MPMREWAVRNSGHARYGIDWVQTGGTLRVTVQKMLTNSITWWNDSVTVTVTINGVSIVSSASINNAFPDAGRTPTNVWLNTTFVNQDFALPLATSAVTVTVQISEPFFQFTQLNNPRNESIPITPVYNAPAAPSTPAVVRVSDASQNVQWNRNATTIAPYASQQIQRQAWDGGAWGAWAGVETLPTFYSNSGSHSVNDTTSVANRKYRFRIRASNSHSEANSAESNVVFTTPGMPSSLTAVRLPSGDIRLTLVHTVTFPEYQSELRYSLNAGTTWTALTTLNSGALTYDWTSVPPGSSVVFDVRTVVNSAGAQGHGLASGRRQSNVVSLESPPNPPSALAPNGVVFDAAEARTFSWQHNTVDSSTQTAYELRYRLNAGAWTSTGKVASTDQFLAFSPSTFTNPGNYEWEVRTWGVHADPSAYSSTATFQTSAVPSVSVTSPGATLESPIVEVEWSYIDPEGSPQSQWEAQLRRGGNLLDSAGGSGTADSHTFSTVLSDATEYQVRARARDGAGLWSAWGQQTFTTDFPLPEVPELSVEWDNDTGSVLVLVTNPAGSPAVAYNEIERSIDGGQTWIYAITIPTDGQGFDRTVPLVPGVLYRALGWSDLPSVAISEEVALVAEFDRGYWSAGPGFNLVMPLKMDLRKPPAIDVVSGLAEKTLHYFQGRTLPVESAGEAVARSGAVSFMVGTEADMHRCREMALLHAPHLFRLPDGTTLYASLGSVRDKRLDRGFYQITMPASEVEP